LLTAVTEIENEFKIILDDEIDDIPETFGELLKKIESLSEGDKGGYS